MVDCSHDNSRKIYRNQEVVLVDVIDQIKKNNTLEQPIIGVMIESNINEGNQHLTSYNYDALLPGISITDGCISIEQTDKILEYAYKNL